jgi:N-acetylglucosamine kinase-like BadF-type ATPase
MLGLAGVGDEREREEIGRRVRELLAQDGNGDLRIAIETDARIALEGALEEVAGLVVIAGTGSVVLGKSPSGEFFRAGGWGRVLGDEGGGFSIGREALKAAMREWDGLGSSGCLREMLESRRSLATRDHVIRAVYRDRLDIAGLAPLVLQGAEHGDAACREILEQESASLVDQVHRVFTLVGGRRGTPLVLLGGLIDHETSYSRILSAAILRRCPDVKIQPARRGPAEGAVLMALRQAGKK